MMSGDGSKVLDDGTSVVLSTGYMDADNKKLIVRLPPELKLAWDSMCADRKISQNDAGTALVEWITRLDAPAQGMILGQQPAAPDLVELVIRRLRGDKQRPPFHVIRKGKVAAVQNAGGEARQLSNEGRGGAASRAPTRG
jgi:hypothetical protein